MNRDRGARQVDNSENSLRQVMTILKFAGIGVLFIAAAISAVRLVSSGLFGGPASTEPGLTVAFIGDAGLDEDTRAVLELIKAENTDLVVHLGDYDYQSNPEAYFALVDEVLGQDFPVVGVMGNHDKDSWPAGCGNERGCYAEVLAERMDRLGFELDDPDLNDQMYSTSFEGLSLALVGEGRGNDDSSLSDYIRSQLAGDDAIWKICAWHENQEEMQVGAKDDRMGWRVYETCRQLGAIIATANEHSYHRTHTLVNFEHQVRDPYWVNPGSLRVAPGATFAFVSGLGGASTRDQLRCLPTTYPYGCFGEWASIYANDQEATHGALFIVFNVDGDPYKARGYFKNVNGEVVDSFTITASRDTLATTALVQAVEADASVSAGDPTVNYGSAPALEVDGQPDKISYLRFDLSGIDPASVSWASLRLFITNRSDDEQVIRLADTNDWDESTLIFDNRPGTTEPATALRGGRSNTWIEVNVTRAVQQAQGGQVTLAIESESGDGIDFASREAPEGGAYLLLVVPEGAGEAGR